MTAAHSHTRPARSFLPVFVGRTEAFFLRLTVAVAVLWSLWEPAKHQEMRSPKGLGIWLDFTWWGNKALHPLYLSVVAAAGLLYLAGIWLGHVATLIGVLILAAAHVSYWTLYNSQGNSFHDSQMLSLALVLQVVGTLIMLAMHRRQHLSPRWPNLDGVLLYFSQCAVVAVYFTSWLSKMANSKGMWLFESDQFAKSTLKTWRQHYYNDLDPKFAGDNPTANWLAENPQLARLIFAPGFLLEMFAFLILWNRQWALLIGTGLVVMHFGVGILMQLYFPECQVVVAIFCVNVGYMIAWARRKTATFT